MFLRCRSGGKNPLQISPSGLQRDSKISVRGALPSLPEATERTTSASSSWLNDGSQSFMNKNVTAAFAPIRLLPSMNAWFWQWAPGRD